MSGYNYEDYINGNVPYFEILNNIVKNGYRVNSKTEIYTVFHFFDEKLLKYCLNNAEQMPISSRGYAEKLLNDNKHIIEEKLEYWHTHGTGNSLKEYLPESNKEPDITDDYDY